MGRTLSGAIQVREAHCWSEDEKQTNWLDDQEQFDRVDTGGTVGDNRAGAGARGHGTGPAGSLSGAAGVAPR